ncbi:hypothetical protein [Paraburkholderia tropica]|uniref:hypothetical protein n=2 Tax=Paraburkholderia tropica TaxID=92647 RepID=UPI0007ECD1E9|nr:hypothetical protein [Paraburkholderia tropica]MBB2979203.1 hypothetical protein [Paraburkholderia tropica]
MAALFPMPFLRRLLLVFAFALLSMRGASACEHEAVMPMTHAAQSVARHAAEAGCTSSSGHQGSSHCHASCCVAGCGVHCGAPPLAARFEAWGAGAHAPPVVAVRLRAGITHAPLLPPPIV